MCVEVEASAGTSFLESTVEYRFEQYLLTEDAYVANAHHKKVFARDGPEQLDFEKHT